MNKNCDEITIEILAKNIASMISCDILDDESLKQKVEDEMKKIEIEQKYGNRIKQMSSNGRWWIRLDDGRVIKKAKREDVINQILIIEKESETTIQSYWDQFIEKRKIARSDGTVVVDIRNYENYILPSKLSTIPLSRISYDDMEKWTKFCLSKKVKGGKEMTEKYFLNVLGTLSQFFQYAKKHKLISWNPASDIEVHRDRFRPAKAHYDYDDYFSEDEEKKVIDIAYADAEKKKSALPLAIPLLFLLGIRDGELCGLHWRDVKKPTVHIQSEVVAQLGSNGKVNGYRWVDHCKTKAGDREIPLNSEVKKLFAEIKKYNLMNGFPISQNDFVFMRNYRGQITFCTTRCFEPRLKRYCREAGMQVLKSQHDIRRTFATNLHYIGVPTKTISDLMGHDSIKQTEEYIKTKRDDNIINELEKLSLKRSGTNGTEEKIKKVGNA